uniref:Uncharacterized protein n=1 Tax=Oryza sativa subsp. japonica TaxID=39947 RepID=Q2R8V0_ORYSJ|nr:hypothetical protein LOC_Os11g10930 [Oryza sativa Japonica Group]
MATNLSQSPSDQINWHTHEPKCKIFGPALKLSRSSMPVRVSAAPTDGEGNGSLALPREASEAGSSGRPAGARRPPPLPLRAGVASLADDNDEEEDEEEAAWRGAAGPACTCPAPTDEEEEEAAGRGAAGPARTHTSRINTVPAAADRRRQQPGAAPLALHARRAAAAGF